MVDAIKGSSSGSDSARWDGCGALRYAAVRCSDDSWISGYGGRLDRGGLGLGLGVGVGWVISKRCPACPAASFGRLLVDSRFTVRDLDVEDVGGGLVGAL